MPHTTHIVRSVAMMASPARTSHLNSFRADTPRQREPSARNLGAGNFHHCIASLNPGATTVSRKMRQGPHSCTPVIEGIVEVSLSGLEPFADESSPCFSAAVIIRLLIGMGGEHLIAPGIRRRYFPS